LSEQPQFKESGVLGIGRDMSSQNAL